jgi:hypothetical protein
MRGSGTTRPSRRRKFWTTARIVVYCVLTIAALAAMVVAWWVMLRMPGASFDGVPGPLTPGEIAGRAEVEDCVRKLGAEIGERNVDRPAQLEAAARYLEQSFAAAGLAPRRETYDVRGTPTSNVVAEIPGATRRDEIVVVGAHYDSVRGSPGGNDNATGVAALLALARRFAHASPARTLRWVAFTCEEPPWFQTESMGSLVHARGCSARGENVVAMLSLESLGCFSDADDSQQYPVLGLGWLYPTRGNFVAFVGDVGSRALVRESIAVFREHAAIASEGAAMPGVIPGVGWSDHWSFRQIAVPSAMVTDTAVYRDPSYHTRLDSAEHVDFEQLTRVVSGLGAVVERLASGPQSAEH